MLYMGAWMDVGLVGKDSGTAVLYYTYLVRQCKKQDDVIHVAKSLAIYVCNF